MQVRSNPDLHFALRVIVPAAQAEGGVGLPFGLGLRVAQHVDDVARLVHEVGDLLFGQDLGSAGAGGGAEARFLWGSTSADKTDSAAPSTSTGMPPDLGG